MQIALANDARVIRETKRSNNSYEIKFTNILVICVCSEQLLQPGSVRTVCCGLIQPTRDLYCCSMLPVLLNTEHCTQLSGLPQRR